MQKPSIDSAKSTSIIDGIVLFTYNTLLQWALTQSGFATGLVTLVVMCAFCCYTAWLIVCDSEGKGQEQQRRRRRQRQMKNRKKNDQEESHYFTLFFLFLFTKRIR
jgi:hypothetical protein